VRERVKHVEADAGERRGGRLRLAERVVPGEELLAALLHGPALLPLGDGALLQLDEDAFASNLRRGQPVAREAETRGLHTEVELALEVGRHGLDTCEADLRANLAELRGDDESLDHRRQRVVSHHAARKEGLVLGRELALHLGLAVDELLELRRAQRLACRALTFLPSVDRREHISVGAAAQRGLHLGDGGAKHGDVVGRRAHQHIPHLRDLLVQRMRWVRNRQRAHDLREVRVARGADEKAKLLGAVLFPFAAQPEPMAATHEALRICRAQRRRSRT